MHLQKGNRSEARKNYVSAGFFINRFMINRMAGEIFTFRSSFPTRAICYQLQRVYKNEIILNLNDENWISNHFASRNVPQAKEDKKLFTTPSRHA